MNWKTMVVLLSLQSIAIPHIYAAEPGTVAEGYHGLVDSWINGEIESEALMDEIGILEDTLARAGSTWDNLYWLARIALIRGQIHYERGDKEASLLELDKSHVLIRESISVQDHSDSWRIMSEASSLIMVQKGFAFIILNFSKSRKQAERSLELDPRNARAHLIIAQFLTNAPRIAGGNLKKGIAVLRDQASRNDLISEDEFLLLLTLSEALQKSKQTDEAASARQEALGIFPGYRKGPTVVIDKS